MPRNISELIASYAEGEDVSQEIYDHFYPLARNAARKRISTSIQSLVDPSGVANIALKSTLSDLKYGRHNFQGSRDFRNFLLVLVRNKAIDEIRDVVPPPESKPTEVDPTNIPSSGDTPNVDAYIKDQIKQFVRVVLSEKDPLDQAIGCQYFLLQAEPKEIHAWLKTCGKEAGFRVLVVRSIQLRIQHMRKRLEDEFPFLRLLDPEVQKARKARVARLKPRKARKA